ncbi:hypothetical protein ACGFZB_35500 [Streptomyces cinerochromogenes]|uniref:Adenylate kinase n=1 Tax=Streptomyces cinerochromogenes TaxID=66422 RepID=A0ABW7BEP5_9ACTN
MGGHRLLITGASGSGTTTLGRTLATLWSVPHADVDDYFWMPTSPPYTQKRPATDRLALMQALFLPRDSWILSGALLGWGDSLIEGLDGVVYLTLDASTRMERLMSREITRYGDTIQNGGINETAHRDFLDWARGYDDMMRPADRTRAHDEQWMAQLPCPVLRLNSAQPVTQLATAVSNWLGVKADPCGPIS